MDPVNPDTPETTPAENLNPEQATLDTSGGVKNAELVTTPTPPPGELIVEFCVDVAPYANGERASFPEARAREFVDVKKWAKWPDKDPVGLPVDQGGNTLPVNLVPASNPAPAAGAGGTSPDGITGNGSITTGAGTVPGNGQPAPLTSVEAVKDAEQAPGPSMGPAFLGEAGKPAEVVLDETKNGQGTEAAKEADQEAATAVDPKQAKQNRAKAASGEKN